MTPLIRVLILVLLLVGAAGPVWWVIHHDPFGLFGGQADGEAPAPPPPPDLIEMDPFLVPIIADGEIKQQFYLTVRLDVASGHRQRVERALPRLQSAFLSDLHAFLPIHLRRREAVDLREVKQRLNRVASGIVGDAAINDVLVQAVWDRNRR